MKKSIFAVLSIATTAMLLVGCKKEESAAPLEPGTAMVKGRITADLDATSLTPTAAPAGTGVTFIISGADLDHNPDPSFSYKNITKRATVNANGEYSISLPARQESISVHVVFDDFEYDATVVTTDDNGFQTTTVARRTFSKGDEWINIVDGQVQIKDFNYNLEEDGFANTATIRGKIEAQFIDNVGPVAGTALDNEGADYVVANNVAVSGGSGTGMVINITSVDAGGEILSYTVVNEGTGYTIGNIVTVSTGNGAGRIEITNVDPQLSRVPANVVVSFHAHNGKTYKVVTNSTGEYMVKLPADGSNVEVDFADFEYATTFYDVDSYVNGLKIYGLGTQTINGVAADNILEEDYVLNRKN